MSNISDVIEEFILAQLDEFQEINLSRNELANYFNVAPSQINYVLSTRFTNPRGFIVESRRGGGGYIKLTRVDLDKGSYIERLITETIQDEITQSEALQLIEEMANRELLSQREYVILSSAITDRALSNPLKMENRLRANILKNVLINIVKGE